MNLRGFEIRIDFLFNADELADALQVAHALA